MVRKGKDIKIDVAVINLVLPDVKDGIAVCAMDEEALNVYNSNKELQDIGSADSYTKYITDIAEGNIPDEHGNLHTDSKVSGIKYHGTGYEFDKFDLNESGKKVKGGE